MADSSKAIFLSYASQDAEAAKKICDALREAGVEVWFDQSELVGGDAWDAKIRGQIKNCALFVPVISANTQARREGYFRLEWKLAAQRSHAIAEGTPFLLPVVIDDTRDSEALVPSEFREVQWTRLPVGAANAAFCARVGKLLGGSDGERASRPVGSDGTGRETRAPVKRPSPRAWLVPAVVALVALAALAIWPPWKSKAPPTTIAAAAVAIAAAPNPATPPNAADPKAIAVLPFTNLSTEKENEFFAEGMHDEVITTLAKIRDLTVKSRTSVMAYKAGARNLRQIAAELGVGTVLQASIQRAGRLVKLNVQLIDTSTDAQLWGDTYTEDGSDPFAVQAKLAAAIARELRAKILPSEQALIARRPTANQDAYDLYLRARVSEYGLGAGARRERYEATVTLYEQAVAKDPGFAVAHAKLSALHGLMYWFVGLDPTPERGGGGGAGGPPPPPPPAAPDAPETIMAEGVFEYRVRNDWAKAIEHYRRVEGDLPNDEDLQFHYGAALRRQGRWAEAANRFRRAVVLNPRSVAAHESLGETLVALRRYAEAERAYVEAAAIFPEAAGFRSRIAQSRLAQDGDVARFWATLAESGTGVAPTQSFGRAFAVGDLKAARQALERSVENAAGGETDANVESRAWQRALLAWIDGDTETARKLAAGAQPALTPNTASHLAEFYRSMATARTYVLLGRAAEAREIAQKTLAAAEAKGAFAVMNVTRLAAEVHAMLGDTEEALALLRRAVAHPTYYSAVDLRLSPLWSKVRQDPRFEEILGSMKPL